MEAGYTHIDCASAYGNEKIVGEALAPAIAEGKRGGLFIVSKVWNDAHRPSDVRWARPPPASEMRGGDVM